MSLDRIISDLPNGFATFDREWRYTYANNRLLEIFELPRAEVLGKRAWEVFPHQVGIEFFDLLNRAMTERIAAQFEFYYEIVGCWVEHRVYPTADGLAILMADISERKQAELLLLQQQLLLELTASGAPMAECLAAVCASVSKLNANVRACILLADSQRETFIDCIAPTFPASLCQGLRSAPINELTICTCGTAVYRGRSVTCRDIASDQEWSQPWRDLCLAHGVLACHSAPILNADDVPLGSLMLCFDTAREPTEWECQLADFGTHIASIVFERDRSSLALCESAAEYRNLFESIDEGFCLVEAIFDAEETPVDYRFLQVNPAFSRIAALSIDVVGKTVRELLPDLEQFWVETYGNVALTGESVRFENESALTNCWYDVYASRVGDAANRRVAIVFNNITERKQAEKISQRAAKFDTFRITLADALRPLADPVEIQATASRVLGEHLGANRVAYFEVRGAIYVVERDYLNGATPLVGNYPIDAFGSQVLAAYRNGRVVSESDLATDLSLSPAERAAYAALGLVAYIGVPLVKGGEFVAGLAIHTSTPRVWTPDDIALAEEVAERTWAALERARAEAALRESAAEYRNLFESIDEGFCIVEAIFDAEEQPVDYRFLQVNPAFFRLTGLPADALGKTALELVTDIEQFWVETYGNVALTGESVRFENESRSMNRWFDVYASRVGDATSRRVAIVFTNITERKQAEKISQRAAKFDAFRITLADALRPLADPVAIQATASRVLGEHLGANRVAYFEVRGAIYVVERDYLNGATPLVGNYPVDAFGSQILVAYRSGRSVSESDIATDLSLSPAERAAYAALGLVAYIGVPLVKGGEFVAGLAIHKSKPRVWTPDEIALAEEVAERTWAALERARAQVALRESEARYRTLFDSIDEGFCIVEMLFDVQQQPVDYRFEQVNPAFSRLAGLPADAVGTTVRELMPDIEDFWIETYGKVALTGEAVRFEKSAPPDRWFDVYASRVGDPDSRRVAIVFNNITERKQAEEISQRAAKFDAFRIALADALRPLADSVEIQVTASRVLGEYLGANRVVYFEAHGTTYVIERDYVNGATSMCGSYPMDSFGSTVLAALHNGQSVAAADVAADPDLSPAEQAAYTTAQIGAYFAIPLVKGGEFVAGLAVHTSEPREWTPDDLHLGAEVAERTWAALERARAEVALQESEARYRTLFESIDEGYILVEMVFDANDRPIDFSYLDANPAAITMLGGNPIGRRTREVFPSLEGHWFETLGRVAQTGIGERDELDASPLGAWYNFYAFSIDNADSRRVAVIFEDITARKRAEANTAFLTTIQDDFARLTTADEIMQTVGEKLSRYLDASQCLFTEIDEAQDRAIVEYNWHSADTLDLVGTYQLSEFVSAEFCRAARARETLVVGNTQTDARTNADRYAAFNVHAFVNVPFHRGNNWKYLLTINDVRARDWREDEIELIDEVANRLFPRIERARAEATVAANLRDTQLLRELGARLVSEDDSQTLYGEILAAAIDLTGADAGTLQILDESTQDLCIIASEGFESSMTERFARVDASSDTSCGIALCSGIRTFVDFDVPQYLDPHGSMRLHVEAGLLSAQSTPLISRTGKAIGMVSTHWHTHHRSSDRQLQFLDLLARQAADSIEQRQTTAALRDREEQLRLATESSKLGLWFWNLETDTLTWTEQCKAIFGLPADTEMSYEIFQAALHPDDRQRTQAAVTRSMAERVDYDIEYRSCWPDGTIHWIAAKGSCTYNTTGTPIQMLGVAIEITDRKLAEEALAERAHELADLNSRLAQSEIQLQERNQELNSFVHIVSHDLKAPLRAVANLSQWIEEDFDGAVSSHTTEQMNLLRGRIYRMEGMIDGLLEYARVGRQDIQLELVSVADLVTEVIESIAPPPTFKLDVTSQMPTLAANRLLVSQVFANLISNAFKHHDRSDGSIRISSREVDDCYEFAICDDGPGIAPEYRDRVFVIFQAANPQKNPDSTGIGLSIVKKIVETAGGRIWLESELGRGTTFYFTWPMRHPIG